jgi:hydroxymethylbilane synthase
MIADRIAEIAGCAVELVRIRTEGDVHTGPLATIGGTGVFVTGVRAALLDGRADVIVHSYKDLPTTPADGVSLAAVPARENPFDALCARNGLTLDELPTGSTVGTGSPRRAAQLLTRRPDLQVVPIRGNVDTRLAKVGTELDGVVLAMAGLRRLGRAEVVTEALDPIQVLPAPAQGALAIECRADDSATLTLLAGLDDSASRAAVAAERALLAGLEAGCSAPVGALAEVTEGDTGRLEIFLRGSVTAIDGTDAVRLSVSGELETAEDLGRRLAAELIDLGANTMMGSSS